MYAVAGLSGLSPPTATANHSLTLSRTTSDHVVESRLFHVWWTMRGILVLLRNRSFRMARPSAKVAASVGVEGPSRLSSLSIGSSMWSVQLGGIYHPARQVSCAQAQCGRLQAYSRHGRIHGQCAFEPEVHSSGRVAGAWGVQGGAMPRATREGRGRRASEGPWGMCESGTKLRQTSVRKGRRNAGLNRHIYKVKEAKKALLEPRLVNRS